MTPKQEIIQRGLLSSAYLLYNKGLNSHVYFKIHDQQLGENLVQDTFVKTWSYLLRGGKIDTMKSFLYHILNHLVIDEYRKQKTTSLDVLMEGGYEPSIDNSERDVQILDGKAAFDCINQLTEPYRKVMRMRHIQNLSLEEISLITKQTKNTVAVQLHRGLEKLRLVYKHA